MNLILLVPEQRLADDRYQLTERQFEHITQVLKKGDGEHLRVGVLNQKLGSARFDKPARQVVLETLDQAPPSALPMTLVMALPRPNMLKRTLMNATAMGVKSIHLLNSAKVEKSYWQSPVLQPESLHGFLLEGLEQARDTQLPTLHMHKRFRPFVEDILPDILKNNLGLLAHPYNAETCPIDLDQRCVLAIGPEGGWNEFEVEKWLSAGFQAVHLGERILKVETAIPVLLSRLYPAK